MAQNSSSEPYDFSKRFFDILDENIEAIRHDLKVEVNEHCTGTPAAQCNLDPDKLKTAKEMMEQIEFLERLKMVGLGEEIYSDEMQEHIKKQAGWHPYPPG